MLNSPTTLQCFRLSTRRRRKENLDARERAEKSVARGINVIERFQVRNEIDETNKMDSNRSDMENEVFLASSKDCSLWLRHD